MYIFVHAIRALPSVLYFDASKYAVKISWQDIEYWIRKRYKNIIILLRCDNMITITYERILLLLMNSVRHTDITWIRDTISVVDRCVPVMLYFGVNFSSVKLSPV